MTVTDQDAAAERSARELERRLRMVCPPSLLADAYAFAAAFVRWQHTEHWRCLPPAPDPIVAARTAHPAPPNDDFLAAKAAITEGKPHA